MYIYRERETEREREKYILPVSGPRIRYMHAVGVLRGNNNNNNKNI